MPARKRRPGQDEAPRPAQHLAAPSPEGGARRVFVLGAGVDMVYGLPTMTTLLRELAEFANGPGLPVHKAIRAKLPRVRFTFDRFAGDKSDTVLSRLFSGEGADLIGQLRSAAVKLEADSETAPLKPLIDRLCDLAERNQLTEGEAQALVQLTQSPYEVGGGESVLEPNRLSLTAVASRGYRHAFQRALLSDAALSDDERDALEFFIVAVSNIEELLSEYFIRFSLEKRADQKTFVYIVWMFWSFLRVRSSNRPQLERSIYAKLATFGGDVVTFNYTNFFDQRTARRVQYFHGRLDEYIKMDTREVVRDDPEFRAATTVETIVQLVENLRLDVDQLPAIDLPGIVPPTDFKPVMGRAQLRVWAKVDDLLQNAGHVVVIGYSFALADEHFNDLLRQANPRSRVSVINPDLHVASREACRILGLDSASLLDGECQGFPTKSVGRLTCVAAKAEDVDEAMLGALSR